MKLKKALAAVLSGALAVCSVVSGADFTQASEEKNVTVLEEANGYKNPVYDAQTDTTDWDYVFYGSYPQSEVTDEELIKKLSDASLYPKNKNVVEIDGERYCRVKSTDANFSYLQHGDDVPAADGEFFEWEDRKTYHYFKYEPLRWRVLESKDNQLLLMADEAIDCVNYMTREHKVNWYISELRSWMNEYDGTVNASQINYTNNGFLTTAFTDDVASALIPKPVYTGDNNFWGQTVKGMPESIGSDSEITDKVFALSMEEATRVEYGFAPDVMMPSKTRQIHATDYARAMGTWVGSPGELQGNCWWTLRTPGDGTMGRKVALGYRDGRVYMEGYYPYLATYYGAVPACYVTADSPYVVKASKKEDKPEPSEEPVPSVEPTGAAVTLGDVDGDGTVGLKDAQAVLRMALHLTAVTNKEAADVDGDDTVGLKDAQLILRKALHLIGTFPVESVPASAQPSDKVEASKEPEPSQEPSQEPLTQPEDKASGKIWIAGDSIAALHNNSDSIDPNTGDAYKHDRATIGWGVIFGKYFNDSVKVNNTALSSRSSKSYIEEPQYAEIMDNIAAGDYLFISFGHNDEFPELKRHTDPYGASSDEGSYKWYLKNYYIDPAIRAGAIPVLVSSVVERNFVKGEFNYQFHSVYKTAMEELVAEYKEMGITIPYIDLHSKMDALYREMGSSKTELLHAVYPNRDSNNRWITEIDNTHFTLAGARYATKYIINGLKELDLSIMDFADADMVATLDSIAMPEIFYIEDLDTAITQPADDVQKPEPSEDVNPVSPEAVTP